jgi:hypothetical protein
MSRLHRRLHYLKPELPTKGLNPNNTAPKIWTGCAVAIICRKLLLEDELADNLCQPVFNL